MKFQVGDVLVLRMEPYGWNNNYTNRRDTRECIVTSIQHMGEGYTALRLSTSYGEEYFTSGFIDKMLIEHITGDLENV